MTGLTVSPYWDNSKGYITKDRATIALLTKERFSTRALFEVIVCQAFTRPIPVRQKDGAYEIWGEGSRPWSLRMLADAAGMSINTVQYALYRLAKIGLIRRISNKIGTVIQALRFYQYRRKNPNVDPVFSKGHFLTPQGHTRVSQNDNYRCGLNTISTKLTSIVAVETPFSPGFDYVKPDTEVGARVRDLIRSVIPKF